MKYQKLLFFSGLIIIGWSCHINKYLTRQYLVPVPKDMTEEQKINKAGFFLRIMDSLLTLRFDIKSLNNAQKKQLGLEKRFRKSTDGVLLESYTVVPVSTKETWFSGGFSIVKRAKKIIAVSGGFGWTKRLNIPEQCDTVFMNLLKGNDIFPGNRRYNYEYHPEYCGVRFSTLSEDEKQKLKGLDNEEANSSLIAEYAGTFWYWELHDSSYTFNIDSSYKDKHIFNQPYLRAVNRLYYIEKYEELEHLLYTNNRLFNWFVAEAIVHFNKISKRSPFSTIAINKANEYNRKNGFAAFRTDSLLNTLYFRP